MTTEMTSGIFAAVRDTLRRRDQARDAWAATIESTVREHCAATRTTRIVTDAGTVSVERVEAKCSQWADGSSGTTGRGTAVCIDGIYALLRPDVGWHDGQNMQYQRGSLRRSSDGGLVRLATVATMAALCRVLPAAIAAACHDAMATAVTEIATIAASEVQS